MTKFSQKNVPEEGVDLGSTCIQRGLATDRATALGYEYDVCFYNVLHNLSNIRISLEFGCIWNYHKCLILN